MTSLFLRRLHRACSSVELKTSRIAVASLTSYFRFIARESCKGVRLRLAQCFYVISKQYNEPVVFRKYLDTAVEHFLAVLSCSESKENAVFKHSPCRLFSDINQQPFVKQTRRNLKLQIEAPPEEGLLLRLLCNYIRYEPMERASASHNS